MHASNTKKGNLAGRPVSYNILVLSKNVVFNDNTVLKYPVFVGWFCLFLYYQVF